MKLLEIIIFALRYIMYDTIEQLGINHEKTIEISKGLDIFILKVQIR